MFPESQISKFISFKTSLAEKWNSDSPASSVFRNMAMLATGSGLARALGIITAPVITRIYLPDHFGVLSIFTAIAAMIVPFGTFRYTMAIPLPRHEGIATNLAVLSAILLSTISAFFCVCFWVAGPAILSLLSIQEVLPYWWLLPLAVAGTGFYEILNSWAVREKAFKLIAKTQVWQKILGSIVAIGLGFLGAKPLGLLIGQIFTQAGGVLLLLRVFWGKIRTNLRHVTKKRMTFLLWRYADFPKYRLPSQFLLAFSTKAPLFFFAWQFGAEVTGQLGLALTMLALPMSLFGDSTGRAYYAEIAKIGRKKPDEIYNLTKNVTKKLFVVSIIPFLILVIFGPWLFQIVFGHLWRQAGAFASVLSFYLVAQFVSSPLVNALNIFEKQWMFLMLNIIRMFCLLVIFSLSYGFALSSTKTLFFYSIALSSHYIFTAYLVFRVIRYSKDKTLI